VVQRVEPVVAVAVTETGALWPLLVFRQCFVGGLFCLLLSVFSLTSDAAVLPEDRADIFLHSYRGGGMSIQAPAVLVRKKVHKTLSLTASHYIDTISSASVDVLARASQYEETRTENTVGMDFLHQKTMMNVGVTQSKENDFNAKSIHVGVAQDFFGDLTNVSLGYSRGNDDIFKTGDDAFSEKTLRQHYRFGVSQVITKNMLMKANVEIITDEGFLNNPYRVVRYEDATAVRGFSYLGEHYPMTRTSTAIAVDTIRYLPYRASIRFRYRYFNDTWGITAHTAQVTYMHAFDDRWWVEGRYRYYRQSKADFYSDLFPFAQSQNFYARDKELSQFDDHSLGVGIRYEYRFNRDALLRKGSVNLFYTHIKFEYDDFRDVTAMRADGSFYPVGQEPFYEFSTAVTRLFISFYY
jgi:hypothetical protein